jgi:hypothetical protein
LVGLLLGVKGRLKVGFNVGFDDVGRAVSVRNTGFPVGKSVGEGVTADTVGCVVGCVVGSSEGSGVGLYDGRPAIGLRVGRKDGPTVGLAVGVEVPRPRTVFSNFS